MAIKVVSKRDVFFYLCCALVCSLIGFLSPFHWFADLFTHFRPQAIIAAGLALPVAGFLKDRRSVVIAILIIAINGMAIGKSIYDFYPPATGVAAGSSATIISSNVHTANRDYAAIIRMVKDQQPDVFVAIEIDDAWAGALIEIESAYPHVFKVPREDNFGMAVYSKIPFKGEALELGNFDLPILRADFSGFSLYALHPPPPVQRKMAEELRLYMGEMQKLAEKTEKPIVVTGDMNTTLWSDNVKFFKAAALKSASSGLVWTWPAVFFPLAIQIDHIFVRGLAVKSFAVLGNVGSDHYPVKAEIIIP